MNNPMKKTFTGLLVIALTVWGYVVVQIISILMGKTETYTRSSEMDPIPAAAFLTHARPPLDTAFRDPFQSSLYAQKPAPPPSQAKPAAAPLKVVDPPTAVVNGILGGEEPVAILKLGDKTELVKAGT